MRLLEFYRDGFRTAKRRDGLAYTVGNFPVKSKTRVSWLQADAPHASYTVDRRLDAMEFQISELRALVDTLYRGA
ncbi:hypothetical protein D3C71_1551550 [compost metagenome]